METGRWRSVKCVASPHLELVAVGEVVCGGGGVVCGVEVVLMVFRVFWCMVC